MLKNGYTLMHEHTTIDLSKFKNEDCNFNDFEQTVVEFKKLYGFGVRNIVDVTNIGMGRDVEYVDKVMKETNINIISATGFYQDKFLPEYVGEMTSTEIANILIKDIEEGIDGTGVKAQIIGEIGTSENRMTENEKKVFLGAVLAHKKTGKKISTHCTLGTYGDKQIEFFKNNGIDLKNVVIGHVDLTGDCEYIINLLKTGVYVEFDTIGKNNYMPDEVRIKCLKRIQEENYCNKVFLSLDITRKSNLENRGGIGYSYIFETFIPLCLKSGIKEEFIEKMLLTNPLNFFKE